METGRAIVSRPFHCLVALRGTETSGRAGLPTFGNASGSSSTFEPCLTVAQTEWRPLTRMFYKEVLMPSFLIRQNNEQGQ
jgi:hypothetical protein